MSDYPRRWTSDELKVDRIESTRIFREERLTEPLDLYLDAFQTTQRNVETYLEQTTDLQFLMNVQYIEEQVTSLFNKTDFLEFLRYLAGPPISRDDLLTLLEKYSFSATALSNNRDARLALFGILRTGLDRERFPWVAENREPLEAEKKAAITATCALIATQRTQTLRRSISAQALEEALRSTLHASGMIQVEPPLGKKTKRKIQTIQGIQEYPSPGHFYDREVTLNTRRIDVMARTWNSKLILCECKASSTDTNSIKRLSNDTVAKALGWANSYGTVDVISVAVLAGRYSLKHLLAAQDSGLYIVWGHRLSDLAKWVESTK